MDEKTRVTGKLSDGELEYLLDEADKAMARANRNMTIGLIEEVFIYLDREAAAVAKYNCAEISEGVRGQVPPAGDS